LFNLKLLILNLSIFVFNLAVCDIQLRLELLKLGHANDVLANLNNLELQLFIEDRLL